MTVCAKVQALVVIYESIFTLLVLLRMIKVMLFTYYQMLWRAPPCKNSNIFFTSIATQGKFHLSQHAEFI